MNLVTQMEDIAKRVTKQVIQLVHWPKDDFFAESVDSEFSKELTTFLDLNGYAKRSEIESAVASIHAKRIYDETANRITQHTVDASAGLHISVSRSTTDGIRTIQITMTELLAVLVIDQLDNEAQPGMVDHFKTMLQEAIKI